MYKLSTSSKDSDDLSIGFDPSRDRRKRELTNNKTIKEKKTPTNLHHPERRVFLKQVNTRNLWTFELGTQDGIIVRIFIFVAFQQNDRQHDQNLNNDTFVRLPIISAEVIIGTEKYPDSGTLLNYADDDYSQVYGQIEETFEALTKDNILQPYMYLKTILDRLMMVIILVIIFTLSIYIIRKEFKALNQ